MILLAIMEKYVNKSFYCNILLKMCLGKSKRGIVCCASTYSPGANRLKVELPVKVFFSTDFGSLRVTLQDHRG